MKVGFYCRTSTGSFACVLPDERQKLHDFFTAEQEKAAKKDHKTETSAPFRKLYFFVVGLTYGCRKSWILMRFTPVSFAPLSIS